MDAIAINPTPTDKETPQDFYATQVATKPPTFVIFVNEEEAHALLLLAFLGKSNPQGLCLLKEHRFI